MFTSVLVANRGEIAVRIIRTLRTMGIRPVLVASVPDRRGLAARSADEVVVLEGYSAAETYLDIDLVIAAAKETGCEAIHPGYGFLSERADFAERCAAEGLAFIGPPPAVLRALGDKSAARALAVEAGVPVVPGYDGTDDLEALAREAARIGFPVMIKARGGGGGRGMREIHGSTAFAEAVESARREAEAAFGDGRLLLEKLVTRAHHVEVQVLADAHGNLVHLGERDCSVQRRRQKLIEESPSPVVDDALRERLTGAALAIARAARYVNAGTVEFLVGPPDESGERPFYFLEVNPRLQVEHPVTEMRTGLDLVEMQLRVAAGEPLPFAQDEVKFEGHAIEFRINAEDPWDDFKPSSGRLDTVNLGMPAEWRRWDAGYSGNDAVPSQYDSLLGKWIVHAESRDEAIGEALVELGDARVGGVATNLVLHGAILAYPAFRAGAATVDWLAAELDQLLAAGAAPASWVAAVAAAAALLRSNGSHAAQVPLSANIADGTTTRQATIRRMTGAEMHVLIDEANVVLSVERVSAPAHGWFRTPDSGTVAVFVHAEGFTLWTEPEGQGYRPFRIVPPPPLPRRTAAAVAGATVVTAPLAGTIADVRVAEGDTVEAGQLVALLDAMKMEHRIVATAAGAVARVAVKRGEVVREGDLLVELG